MDGVAHLGADQGLVSEIVVAGDELVPEPERSKPDVLAGLVEEFVPIVAPRPWVVPNFHSTALPRSWVGRGPRLRRAEQRVYIRVHQSE